MKVPDVNFMVSCPSCSTELKITTPDNTIKQIRKAILEEMSKNEASGSVDNNDLIAMNVKSDIKPIGTIRVYKITSDDIKIYLNKLASTYATGVKVEVLPRYTEKKNKYGVKSYTALEVGMSENVVQKQSGDGFYTKIGESSDNVYILDEIWNKMVKKYKFNKKEIEGWLGSYKRLEELEEKFGITEKFLNDIKLYSTPRRYPIDNKDSWIVFAARVDLIIADMLSSPTTHNLEGSMEIHKTNAINKNLVEFIVYIHPKNMRLKENPFIRKLLEDSKK